MMLLNAFPGNSLCFRFTVFVAYISSHHTQLYALPMQKLFFCKYFQAVGNDPSKEDQREDMEDASLKWSLYYVFVGVESFIGVMLQVSIIIKVIKYV